MITGVFRGGPLHRKRRSMRKAYGLYYFEDAGVVCLPDAPGAPSFPLVAHVYYRTRRHLLRRDRWTYRYQGTRLA